MQLATSAPQRAQRPDPGKTYWLALAAYREPAPTPEDPEAVEIPQYVSDAVAAQMLRRINAYAERMRSSGRADVWRRMSRLQFSRDSDSGLRATDVTQGGEKGEMIGTRANLLGRYSRAVSVMVAGSRPSFSARSIASSAEAVAQVNACNALLDFVLTKKKGEQQGKRAELFMQLYGEGWLSATWDERAGKPLGQDAQGRQRYDGDIRITAKRPDEVVRDIDLDETSEHEWLIVARQVNRWKLAQQHPQLADYIRETDTRTELETIRDNLRLDGLSDGRRRNGDTVTVYELFSPPSILVPEGVYAMLLGSKLIALDKALYDDLAHYEMIAEYEPGTKNGHSFLWDLCGLQQCSDSVLTAIISTIENYGKPVLFIPEGSMLNTDKSTQMKAFHEVRGTVKPEFVSLDPGILQPLMAARQSYQDDLTMIAGVNDTVMGDASKSQSGEALATLSALAQQSVSSLQGAYVDGLGDMMFGSTLRFRRFATEERIIQVTGNTYTSDVAKFKAADIASIDGIDMQLDAAIMRSSAGRKEVADKLWQAGPGVVITAEQYLEVQSTGRLEPITKKPSSAQKLIEAENERLREGKQCMVFDTDDDRAHIAEHSTNLDDPDLRMPNEDGTQKPGVMVTNEHIQQHMQALLRKTPDICAALGQQPLPSVMMAAMAPPAPPPGQGGDAQPGEGEQPAQESPPNVGGPVPTGAGAGLPPTGIGGADVAATEMPATA